MIGKRFIRKILSDKNKDREINCGEKVQKYSESPCLKVWTNDNRDSRDPFDKRNIAMQSEKGYQDKRFFDLNYHGTNIELGNVKVLVVDKGLYEITGVNTVDYARCMGVAIMAFSYELLRMMQNNEGNDFAMRFKNGTNVVRIWDLYHKYVYRSIVGEKTERPIEHGYEERVFKLETREEDYAYFKSLYEEKAEEILARCKEIEWRNDNYASFDNDGNCKLEMPNFL